MYPLGAAVIPEALIAAQAGQPDVGRRGNEDWGSLLSGVFRCRGADSWVAVSIADEAGLQRLGELVGSVEPKPDGVESLQRALERWCASRDPMLAAAELQAAGIPAGPVNNARDLICDPHHIARQFCEDVDFGGAVGRRPLIGRPYRWPGMDVAIRGPAPRFGADNDALLGDLLAMPKEAIDVLRRTGVIADRPTLLPELGPENLQALVELGTLKEADAHYRDVVVQRRRVPSSVGLVQD
jgi:crotonobetainyl-CoA:carnitine CoA-transferase CaiB-like acyl-CoA transferase